MSTVNCLLKGISFFVVRDSLTVFANVYRTFSILKLFAAHKDDRRLVEKALDRSGLPSQKNDEISTDKLVFQDFFNFYQHLVQRREVESIFSQK
jgi:hypothetical protein